MTVDEKVVAAGMSQRRPKPHVDGCFEPRRMSWESGSWTHYRNKGAVGAFRRMPVIVAATVEGCRAWRGKFDGQPADDGDLSHLALNDGEMLPANVGYLLSPDCVHESMVFNRPTPRTFLRIALPVDFKFDIDRASIPATVAEPMAAPDDQAMDWGPER